MKTQNIESLYTLRRLRLRKLYVLYRVSLSYTKKKINFYQPLFEGCAFASPMFFIGFPYPIPKKKINFYQPLSTLRRLCLRKPYVLYRISLFYTKKENQLLSTTLRRLRLRKPYVVYRVSLFLYQNRKSTSINPLPLI